MTECFFIHSELVLQSLASGKLVVFIYWGMLSKGALTREQGVEISAWGLPPNCPSTGTLAAFPIENAIRTVILANLRSAIRRVIYMVSQ